MRELRKIQLHFFYTTKRPTHLIGLPKLLKKFIVSFNLTNFNWFWALFFEIGFRTFEIFPPLLFFSFLFFSPPFPSQKIYRYRQVPEGIARGGYPAGMFTPQGFLHPPLELGSCIERAVLKIVRGGVC